MKTLPKVVIVPHDLNGIIDIGSVLIVVPLAALLLSCGVAQEEYDALATAKEALEKKVTELESERSKLLEELQDLRKTDQGLWQTAKQQEDRKQWRELESTLDELLSRWPESPLGGRARSLRRTARERVAERIYSDAQNAIKLEKGELARSNFERLINNYSETAFARRARLDLGELEKKLKAAADARAKAARDKERERQRASSVLELTSFSWNRQSGYAIVEGQVKNISSRSLENVQAVAIFLSPQGEFVKSDNALIEYRPLLPGQSSPFKVMSSWNPAMKSCRMEFKQLMGPELPTFHNWRK